MRRVGFCQRSKTDIRLRSTTKTLALELVVVVSITYTNNQKRKSQPKTRDSLLLWFIIKFI